MWKAIIEKMMKTDRVMTSWRILSCMRLKGPSLPVNPIRLAGTWRQYSKKAIDQLKRMIAIRGRFLNHGSSFNLR